MAFIELAQSPLSEYTSLSTARSELLYRQLPDIIILTQKADEGLETTKERKTYCVCTFVFN